MNHKVIKLTFWVILSIYALISLTIAIVINGITNKTKNIKEQEIKESEDTKEEREKVIPKFSSEHLIMREKNLYMKHRK